MVGRIEKIEPEKCKNEQDFDKALEKWAGQLDSMLDNSPKAKKLAACMAENYSHKSLLEMRKNYDDSGAKFKDACFGPHDKWSPEQRTEEIGKAKKAWETNHIGAHRIDMALDLLGSETAASDEGTSGTKPDDGEGTTGSPAVQSSLKQTLVDLGGRKVEKQEPLQVKPDDGPDFGGRSFGTLKVNDTDAPSSDQKWTDIRNTTDGTAINIAFAEEEAEKKQKKAEKVAQPRVVAQWHGNVDGNNNQHQNQNG